MTGINGLRVSSTVAGSWPPGMGIIRSVTRDKRLKCRRGGRGAGKAAVVDSAENMA